MKRPNRSKERKRNESKKKKSKGKFKSNSLINKNLKNINNKLNGNFIAIISKQMIGLTINQNGLSIILTIWEVIK